MLAWCAATGRTIKVSKHDFLRVAIIGILLLTGGNVLLAWSAKYVDSGLAALIVAVRSVSGSTDRRFHSQRRSPSRTRLGRPRPRHCRAGGFVVARPPANTSAEHAKLAAAGALLFGSLSWTVGSRSISRRSKPVFGPFAATGWEMTVAGAVNLLISIAIGEPSRGEFGRAAASVILYLVTFGSMVGFTAYIWLLEHVPTPKVATYAYVNPVVAVFLDG